MIDFKTFNPKQLEVIKLLAEHIDSEPMLSEIIEYKGGYMPKQSYIGAVRAGKEAALDIIPATRTGALLARNVSVIIGMNMRVAQAAGDEEAQVELRLAGKLAAQAMSSKDIAEQYHDWYMACANVPKDISETALGLLFVGEFIDATIRTLKGNVEEMIRAMLESKNATRH